MNNKLLSNINNGIDRRKNNNNNNNKLLCRSRCHSACTSDNNIIKHHMLVLKKKISSSILQVVGFRGGRAVLQWTREHHNTLARSFSAAASPSRVLRGQSSTSMDRRAP
ncbi:unnamed protein product [Heterosigma akashiwo]